MAETLTTKEIAVALDNIIKRAEKYICIFTFNIKIDETYMSRLRNAAKRGVQIVVVFGVNNGKPEVLKSLQEISGCKVYFKEYLHAKFFYNEKQLLVGSMNLSEASEKNNYELSVLMSVADYPELFKKVKEEAREIIGDAIEWSKISVTNTNSTSISTTTSLASTTKGKCIRCAKTIGYNPGRPLCHNCYSEWSEWENEYYLESYCHHCGKEREGVSFAHPECKTCYKNEKQLTPKPIANSGLDQTIKDILNRHLKINQDNISIDFNLSSLLSPNNPKGNAALKELETKFKIKRLNDKEEIKDYWDLYSLILKCVNK